MAAILPGMARLDAHANPQPEPPDRELAQVEQGVVGTEGNAVIAADIGRQATLLDLTSTPAGKLVLNVQDVVLHLEGEFMGTPIGTSAAVCQPLNAAFPVAIEDLVTGLERDSKLPEEFRPRLKSFIPH